MILAPQSVIKEWTEKGAWGTRTLIDYFKGNVGRDPEKICIVDPPNKEELTGTKPQRLTYREFDRAVDAVAEGLVEKGVRKDDIIVVQLPNCWELAMLYLAIARSGALTTPMPMQWRESELDHVVKTTSAKIFITLEDFRGFKHAEMGKQYSKDSATLRDIITLGEIRKMAEGKITGRLQEIPIDANDIFTLCWSSGTEAKPKGCPLSHNNWIIPAFYSYDVTGMRPGDNLITLGPLTNMGGIGGAYINWLVGGGKLTVHHPFEPEIFIKQLVEEEVNYTLLVPAVINMILKHPKVDQFDLSKLRAVTIGTAPPSLWSVKELKRRWGIEFGNFWGMNEQPGFVSSGYDVPDMEKRIDHFPQIGKSGKDWYSPYTRLMQTKIVDTDTGKELTEVGGIGELYIRTSGTIPCYFNNPELTAKSFDAEGYLKTGDLFQIKEGNCMGYFDRAKDIIIRGGFNISAQEVENMLLGHPMVADVAAVAMPDDRMGEKVCVYVVPRGEITLESVTSFMVEKGLAKYKLPERLEIVKAIPRNPVGKILKKDLRADIKQKLSQANQA